MPAPELTGRVLGNAFEIQRLLGEGGFGAVYVARHVRTGKQYAVKVLNDERGGRAAQEARERFKREADALAALGHPGIVAIHDFAQTEDGIDYLVMDLLSGEDLATRMQRVGRLPLPDALAIIRQVGAALGAAHRAGILHRDLKPANVFLATADGLPERAMILDFGLAKLTDANDQQSLTVSGLTMGTPLYMSPEQATGASVDQRADIYALATIFYEVTAGETPFEAPTIPALMVKIMTAPPPPLSSRINVPAHVDEAIARAMRKDPAERFPDVTSFLYALEGHSGAQTQAAIPSARAEGAATFPETRDQVAPALPVTRDAAPPDPPPTSSSTSIAAPPASMFWTRIVPLAVGGLGLLVAAVTVAWVVAAPSITSTTPAFESASTTPTPPAAEESATAPAEPTPATIVTPAPEAETPRDAEDEPTAETPSAEGAAQSERPASRRVGRRGAGRRADMGTEAAAPAHAPLAATPPTPAPTAAAASSAQVEAYRTQAQSYRHQVREIQTLLGHLPTLRRGVRGLDAGREPPICRSSLPQNLAGARDVQIVVSMAQTLRNDVERLCEPFQRVHAPPPEVQRQLQTIDSTLDRAEQMARDRSISTNTPPEIASQVEAAVGEARRVLAGVPEGRKPFPCDAPVFSRLRRLGNAGNVWSGAAADRVVRLRDRVCSRLGVDREQLARNHQNFINRLDSTEGTLRQTERTYQRLVDQYEALIP